MSNTIPNNPVQTVAITDFSPGIVRFTVGENPVYYSPSTPPAPLGSASNAYRCRNIPGIGLTPFYAYTTPLSFPGLANSAAPDGTGVQTQTLAGVGCIGGLSSGNVTSVPDQAQPQDDLLAINVAVQSNGGGFYSYGFRAFFYNNPWGSVEALWSGLRTALPSGCSFDQTTQWEVGANTPSPTPAPGTTPPSPPPINGTWQQSILAGIGAPQTANNIAKLTTQNQCEGNLAGQSGLPINNPLNTTLDFGGGVSINSAGVKAYPTLAVGIQATVETFNNTAAYQALKQNLVDDGSGADYAALLTAAGTWTSGTCVADHLASPASLATPTADASLTPADIIGRALNTASAKPGATSTGWYLADGNPPYSRTLEWLNSTTFSQPSGSGGWRMDCSGFVSQAWDYPQPGFIVGNGSNGLSPGILSDPAGWGFSYQRLTPGQWPTLQPGDAITFSDHMCLVVSVTGDPNTTGTFDIVQELNTAVGTQYVSGVTQASLSSYTSLTPLFAVRSPGTTGGDAPLPLPTPPTNLSGQVAVPTSILVCQPLTTDTFYTPTQQLGSTYNTFDWDKSIALPPGVDVPLLPIPILAAFTSGQRVGVIQPIVYPVGNLTSLVMQGDDILAYSDPPTMATPPQIPHYSAVYNYYTLENASGFGAWGSVSTGELVMIRRGQGAVIVAGDPAFPTFVTKLPAVHGTGQIMQKMTQCQAGSLYVTETDGVYSWNGGNTSAKISPQIPDRATLRTDLEPNGVFGPVGVVGARTWHDVLDNLVFFPNNWVFDSTANSWWQCEGSTVFSSGGWAASGSGVRFMYGVSATPVDNTFPVYQFDATTLASSYLWQSNPLPSSSETLVTIIRVELVASNPTPTPATVTVTPTIPDGNVSRFANNPQTVEFTIPAETSGFTAFLPLGFTEYNVCLRLDATNTDPSNPAPAIHALYADLIEAQTTGITGPSANSAPAGSGQ